MKRIIKILNGWGIYFKFQYNEWKMKEKELKNEVLATKMTLTSHKIHNEQLRKQLKELPLGFNALVNWYSKNQLNALVYEIVNHAYGKKDFNDLLPRWAQRIKSAEDNLNPKVDQDTITPSHFPGH